MNRLSIDARLAAGLAVLLIVLGVATGAGVVQGTHQHLGANIWVTLLLTLLGAGAIGLLLVWSPAGPIAGAAPVVAFAAFTALTALSIAWSVAPDASWSSAGETVGYLGVFVAAATLARLFPRRWLTLCWAVSGLAVAISSYALLGKVFPALPDTTSQLGRVTAPLGYWNAIGLLAAQGIAGVMWIGARETRSRTVRVLCVPAVTVLATALTLSYSRSADISALVAVGLVLALTQRWMRALVVLVPGLIGATVLTAAALTSNHLSDNFSTHDTLDGLPHPLTLRTAAAHTFGWELLLVLALTTVAGYVIVRRAERTTLSATGRRRVVIGLLCLAALLPVGGVVKLASSTRGLTGEISHIWTELTSTNTAVGTESNRLTDLANSRPRYWHDAFSVAGHHLLFGAGALGYAVARYRYTTDFSPVQNAHGFLFETLADLGLVGVLLALGLLVLWWRSAARTIGLRSARTRLDDGGAEDERSGHVLLFALVVAFGVSSAIDWTWLVPATAVPALLCAGWLAGRGPLTAPVGRRPSPRTPHTHPALPFCLSVTAVAAILLCWTIWQPLRSVQAVDAAVSAADAGNGSAAVQDANAAVAQDPFNLQALTTLSSLYQELGVPALARHELVVGTQRQGQNSASWYQLGVYDLAHGQPAVALAEFQHAHMLNPGDAQVLAGGAAAGAQLQRLQSRAQRLLRERQQRQQRQHQHALRHRRTVRRQRSRQAR